MNIKIALLLNILLYGLLIFGITGTSGLVSKEFLQGDICPNLVSIPACYIIFLAFLSLLTIHVIKLKSRYFYIIAAIPFLIALYGTVSQIFGFVECPKTETGIPMCFISLAIFSTITLCKYFLGKVKND